MEKNKNSIEGILNEVNGYQKLNDKYLSSNNGHTPNIDLPKRGTHLNDTLNQATGTQELRNKYENDEDSLNRPKRITSDQNNLLRNYKSNKRTENPISPKKLIKRSLMKRFMPYLIAGGSTGIGIGLGFKSLIM